MPHVTADTCALAADQSRSLRVIRLRIGAALLPVKLTKGHMVGFGVWLAIHPKDLMVTLNIWWDPAREHLHLGAWLADVISPWGCWPARLKPRSVTSARCPTVFRPPMRP